MKKQISFLTSILLSLCSFSQTTISETIQHNNLTREYRIYIPASYTGNESVPLLFNLHGYTSDNQAQEVYGDFRPIADTANFIVVHPNGTFDQSSNRYWNAFGGTGADDVGFISALIDSISATYNIDVQCIYSTGMSNGGFMSYKLACELGNRITAVASVTGSMVFAEMNSCNPAHPTPIMQIHGTADGTVPYNGSPGVASIDSLVNFWIAKNNCDTTPTITAVPNINTSDNCTADNHLYENGSNNTTIELYKIDGGGHTWPGAPINIGVTNQDFDASEVIWQFFSQYKLDMVSGVTYSNAQVRSIKVFPNPTNDKVTITIENYDGKAEIIITNLLGNTVLEQISFSSKIELQLPNSAGLYFIQVKTGRKLQTLKVVKK